MKAHVYVTPKRTVLDPQGQTIARALNGMGHPEILGLRQGKFFELEIAPGLEREAVLVNLEKIAAEVLSNPVIEEYRVEVLD